LCSLLEFLVALRVLKLLKGEGLEGILLTFVLYCETTCERTIKVSPQPVSLHLLLL